MEITIVGAGFVGIALAKVLSKKHNIICYDTDIQKLECIDFLNESKKTKHSSNYIISKVFKSELAYSKADYVFVCVSSDYDEKIKTLDMSKIKDVIDSVLKYNKKAKIVIKSTLSMESISILNDYSGILSIFYSPEFLRENSALYDTLHPSRIVVGYLDEKEKQEAIKIADLLNSCTEEKKSPIIVTKLENAIAIKLFSNAYLAMRLSFFNELDSFAHIYQLDSNDIINGVSLDSRIGNQYNNPSFGFKGYCLPKDTQSLISSFLGVPSVLIPAILESNQKRIDYVIDELYKMITKNDCKIVGIYRIAMEKGATSIRFSIMDEIIKALKNTNIKIVVYEPLLNTKEYLSCPIVSLEVLLDCDIIVANRMNDELKSDAFKVFTFGTYEK